MIVTLSPFSLKHQNQTKRSESSRDQHKIHETTQNSKTGRDQPKTVQNQTKRNESSRDQHKIYKTTQNSETSTSQACSASLRSSLPSFQQQVLSTSLTRTSRICMSNCTVTALVMSTSVEVVAGMCPPTWLLKTGTQQSVP